MNISPISYNYTNINKNTQNNIPRQVSFCGGKLHKQTQHNAILAVGCLLAPFVILSEILTNKKDEINRLTLSMQQEYKSHLGKFKYFQNDVKEMNKIVNKHTVNDSYAQFTKEAIEFLQTIFKNNQGACDDSYRMDIFKEDELGNLAFIKFMDTIKKSAIVAVSKRHKDIDISELDKNIQEAREIMKNKSL